MSYPVPRLMIAIWLPVAFLLFGSVAVSQDTDLRTWWSHDGDESLVASFENYDKKTKIVTLKDEDNEKVTVKITLLSRADRKFVVAEAKKLSVFSKKSVERKADQQAINDKQNKRPGKKPKVFRRYGISWTPGVENALTLASDEKSRKPVMWFRVLGNLNGFM